MSGWLRHREAFDPLDARQLAKHFLAAKRPVADSSHPG